MKWYSIQENRSKWRVYNVFLGGRGIGKTYSAIDYVINSGRQFMYLRTTEKQIDLSCGADRGNPFKKWAADHNRIIYINKGSDINDVVEETVEEEQPVIKRLGYACALSTFENLRGVDFSSIDIILYDEFIQIQPFHFDAFRSFLNLYESVNRNRELDGMRPVQVFFLANTQEIDNPILIGFNLVTDIDTAIRAGQKKISRGDFYIELCESVVSRMKEQSVLYRNLDSDDQYKNEAIHNKFSRNDFSMIGKPKNLREYAPICNIDGIGILKHKSRKMFYCSKAVNNKVPYFNSKNQRGLFIRHYGGALLDAYAAGTLKCDTYITNHKILEILKII